MDYSDITFPLRRQAAFREISPSVHWAQRQALPYAGLFPPRQIYDFELLYVREGEVHAHIGDNVLEVGAGGMFMFSAGIRHYLEVRSKPVAVLDGVHFDFFDEFDIERDEEVIAVPGGFRPEHCCVEPVLPHVPPLSDMTIMYPSEQTVACLVQVIDEFALRLPGYEMVCRGLMQQMLAQLYRLPLETLRSPSAPGEMRTSELVGYIHAKYREDCSNAALARRLNVHEDYMAKQFKSAVGMPPNKYVQLVRHREAKRLLRETAESMETIGEWVGYDDIHYFSRVFRKHEGMSPREYRRLTRLY